MQICADKRNFFIYFCMSIFECYDTGNTIKREKDKHLYQLLAPLVMDPDVIRANNNYPFKNKRGFRLVHCD